MNVAFEDLSKGDRILFNDRKEPLEVKGEIDDGVEVEGPGGGEYVLIEDEGTLLVAKKGERRYASYLEDLRRTGEWEKADENTWEHSISGAEIVLQEEENGIWKLSTRKFDPEIDTPGMGYMQRQTALEDVEKIIRRNPEGGL